MRRKDREIVAPEEMDAVITRCDCCRLALWDTDTDVPYIVPLNFGYVREGEKPVFFFHSAAEGRKIDLLHKHPRVGFELDTAHRLVTDPAGDETTMLYESVIGTGTVTFLEDMDARRTAMAHLLAHYGAPMPAALPPASRMAMLRLDVEEMTAKANRG